MEKLLARFKKTPGDASMGAVEREFLPAALEIMKTPPSPLGRMMTWAICAFAVVCLIWTSLARIDIVAVASGKIITRARTQVVQAPETGIVKSILVEPGQRVKQGEALIQLETETILAEVEHAQTDLAQGRLDEVRLRAFIEQAEFDGFGAITDIDALQVTRARLQLTAQKLERQSRLSAIDRDRDARRADLMTSELLLRKGQDVLPLIQARAGIRAKAAEIEFGNKLLSLEAQQQVLEITAEIGLQRQKIAGLQATIAALEHQKAQTEAEFLKVAYNDLARALAQKSAATEALAKASRRLELATIRSPVDGIVNQLNVRTLGGVVTPAQQLVSVGPEQSPLEVEVVLPNRDAGFVAQNQDVEIKVEAYPFTRYGMLKGRVIAVAQDAEPQPNAYEGAPAGSQRKADQSASLEGSERLLYMVRVSIEPDSLQLDGKPAPLIPGMSVRAEIKTGARSLLEYLIAPLSEYMHQSMRER